MPDGGNTIKKVTTGLPSPSISNNGSGNPPVGIEGPARKPPEPDRPKADIKKEELEQTNFKKTLKFAETWVVSGFGFLSAITGVLSFTLHNLIKKPSELLDKIATLASKGSVFAVAIFGGITKAENKDTFGTSAFVMDFLAPLVATGENLYQWKGFGSGTDHSIPIASEIKTNSKIQEQYNSGTISANGSVKFKGFLDSAKILLSGAKAIFGDIVSEFKKNSFGKAFMNCFINANKNGNRTAEKNLLISGLGIVAGAFTGMILKFKLVGATIRDLFGLYADLAYIDKGRSKVAGELDEKAKKEYFAGGVYYTIGSILDLIYRWTGIEGLNLCALGIDRLGHTRFVKGVARDIDSTGSNGNHSP